MYMPLWLEQRSLLTPNRTALEMGNRVLTFLELRNRARALAVRLKSLHIKEGDVVACLSGNDIAVVEIVHALHYAGAIFLPLNPRLSAYEQQFQLQDANAKLLLYSDLLIDEQRINSFSDLPMTMLNINQLEELEEPNKEELDQLLTTIHVDAVQTIMYTSGTTGTPKGVLISASNHWTGAIGSALNLGLYEQDSWLLAVPMFHISGLSILMRSVIYGMRVVVLEKFDEAAANQAIHQRGITIMSVVSNMLSRMLAELGDKTYPAGFRCMLLGGGPAPKPLLEACVEKHIPVVQTYGMTETAAQIVTLPPEYMLSKLGSAGKPLFQAQLKIMTDGVEAMPYEAGDIYVYGTQVTKGYLNRPEANASTFVNGWLNTGDIGYVDEEGFLYVLDRRKDMFVSGGENVYPAEIEAVLLAHEAIIDAGVTSVEDDTWGYVGAAYIVLTDEYVSKIALLGEKVVLDEIKISLQTRLAKYKIPKHLYPVKALPRNAANKLLRRELYKLQSYHKGKHQRLKQRSCKQI